MIRQHHRVARVLTVAVTATLVAGVMLAQWLAMFPVVPHAPLHDCRQHHCGCPAELTARRACCCFASGNVASTTLQSAHCDGSGAPQSATIAKLHWVAIGPDEPSVAVVLATTFEPVKLTLRTRSAKPPVPPPRLLLDV
jgi:hypothetical protein